MVSGRKLLLVALNEFNRPLLEEAVDVFSLPHLGRLTRLHHIGSFTRDTYDSDFLEPWSQWVNVHTGKETREHGIKHLGDTPELSTPQLWETLSKHGLRSCVWGALNAKRGRAPLCTVFVPDPWTYSEQAYPEDLQDLVAFPRYVAKNRTSLSGLTFLNHAARAGRYFTSTEYVRELVTRSSDLASVLPFFREEFLSYNLFEYFSGLMFLDRLRSGQQDFGFLFLNSVAHVQHYHWKGPLEANEKLRYTLALVDAFLGKVFELDGYELICTNGLSQKNTADEPPWVSYRISDFARFFDRIGLEYDRVESLMSYDGHLLFKSVRDRQRAEETLASAVLSGRKMFLVEPYASDEEAAPKLFFRSNFYAPTGGDEVLEVAGRQLRFGDYFSALATRTGRHIPVASIYTSVLEHRTYSRLANHQVHDLVTNFFGIGDARLDAPTPSALHEITPRAS